MSTQRPSKNHSKVIVVVDDQALRDSLKFSLEVEGFDVRVYADSLKLLAETELPKPCCLVVDQNMSGMSGLDLVKALRKRDMSAPVILISSDPTSAVRECAGKSGAFIVEKPFFGGVLIDRIRHAVSRGQDPTQESDRCKA